MDRVLKGPALTNEVDTLWAVESFTISSNPQCNLPSGADIRVTTSTHPVLQNIVMIDCSLRMHAVYLKRADIICGSASVYSTNQGPEIFAKKIVFILNMHTFLSPLFPKQNSIATIYFIFGIMSNLEMTWEMWEGMCKLHINILPFYRRDLRIHEFWYPRWESGRTEPIPYGQ